MNSDQSILRMSVEVRFHPIGPLHRFGEEREAGTAYLVSNQRIDASIHTAIDTNIDLVEASVTLQHRHVEQTEFGHRRIGRGARDNQVGKFIEVVLLGANADQLNAE